MDYKCSSCPQVSTEPKDKCDSCGGEMKPVVAVPPAVEAVPAPEAPASTPPEKAPEAQPQP